MLEPVLVLMEGCLDLKETAATALRRANARWSRSCRTEFDDDSMCPPPKCQKAASLGQENGYAVLIWRKRMVRQRNGTRLATVCLCCGGDVDTTHHVDRPPIPFCRRCGSGKCKKCWSWVRARRFEQDPSFNLIGRPRGPRMPCGWKCGAAFTGHEMRAHFSRCPKRAAVSSDAERRSRRGRPLGHRMPCGRGCGLRLSASEMRTHFTACLKRPDR